MFFLWQVGPQNYNIGYGDFIEQMRRNTYWMTGVLESTHDLWFSNTLPTKLRLHMRDAGDSWMVVKVHYRTPNRVDVHINGQRVAPVDSWATVDAATAPAGTNFHE